MRTFATIFMILFALNISSVVHAEDGSMRYREMVENLREQNKERREAREKMTQENNKKNNKNDNGGILGTPDNR